MRASKSKLQFGNFLFFFWHCSKGINNTSPCSSNLGGDHLTFNLVGGWFLNNLQAYLYKNQIHAHELCWIKEFKHVHGTEKKSPTPRKKLSCIQHVQKKKIPSAYKGYSKTRACTKSPTHRSKSNGAAKSKHFFSRNMGSDRKIKILTIWTL